jgi:hypothetical protein
MPTSTGAATTAGSVSGSLESVLRALRESEEFEALQSSSAVLQAQLAANTQEGALECSRIVQLLPEALLLRATRGGWAEEWNEELR